MTVDLGTGPEPDALAFERTRVVTYLEGEFPSQPVTGVLEQKNRQFSTDTLVMPVGSMYRFRIGIQSSTTSFHCLSPRLSISAIMRRIIQARLISISRA